MMVMTMMMKAYLVVGSREGGEGGLRAGGCRCGAAAGMSSKRKKKKKKKKKYKKVEERRQKRPAAG